MRVLSIVRKIYEYENPVLITTSQSLKLLDYTMRSKAVTFDVSVDSYTTLKLPQALDYCMINFEFSDIKSLTFMEC